MHKSHKKKKMKKRISQISVVNLDFGYSIFRIHGESEFLWKSICKIAMQNCIRSSLSKLNEILIFFPSIFSFRNFSFNFEKLCSHCFVEILINIFHKLLIDYQILIFTEIF